ncbi:probable receptor-like protein kinase At5g38990 isoform X2 [Amaranthus tricolor]|uniref:probable receptor-like protein kinase At5g38990 isoform X2 n=1 Tax=Amaranthus tricolor TaxID=29722 RepID=UPI0025851B27|nr:probable receptor-like protein kinase At5g38990 isoform X2 [Amaranthus tricolor]XP_057522120.1 probable receptor-like protein kinase At5g38990 isoform X2 [Amaranthus tricolor]
MFVHPQMLLTLLFFLFITTLTNSITAPYKPPDHLLINFGLPKNSPQPIDNRGIWQSDQDFILTSLSATSNSTAFAVEAASTPYHMARIFRATTTYSIPVTTWGPKLVRLYFPPLSISYDIIDTKSSFLSLTINGFNILRNFSAFAVTTNANTHANTTAPVTNGLVREIYISLNEGNGQKGLNLTFSPSNPDGFGFINGLEIISAPDGLYFNRSESNTVPYLTGGFQDLNNQFNFSDSIAMENIIRLNVGGSNVDPRDDSGLRRTWFDRDDAYMMTINYTVATPSYMAPELVYLTMKEMGAYVGELKKNKNLTWLFEVDVGFNYLVRLHFCELVIHINKTGQRLFDVSINNQMGAHDIDVFALTGGIFIPMYKDFVTLFEGSGTNKASVETRGLLSVTLTPDPTATYDDVLLNGLEIFKLNSSNGSLAAPNPSIPMNLTSLQGNNRSSNSSHHLISIIGGILGAILVVALISSIYFIIIFRRKKEKQKFMKTMSKDDTSKLKWISPLDDPGSNATTASVIPSLPSDLCRRFSFAQVRVATNDFDDDLIIGTGGFGKVYKGSIDDGATIVAIKRLTTTSKQGAREFETEIEMLSRLRHVHLVSLIGYCDEYGEMIIVYEYMPRGTLRDHLLYKNPERSENHTPLSWKQRLMICLGSARGLHYLHAGAKQLIIHRDVKSTNILLDDKWTAKVSDFGLSKVGPTPGDMGPTHVSTAVKGSVGYLDPEYYRRQQLTEKSDVYSFGVLLFEVLCARVAMNPNLPKQQVNLAVWARYNYKNKTLHTIVDPNLTGQIAPECLRKFGEVAEMCIREHGNDRPSMGDVVWGIEFALQLQETAEKIMQNNLSDDPQGEISDSTISFKLDEAHALGSMYIDDESTTLNDDFSDTKMVDMGTKKLLDSRTTTFNSSESPIIDMKSGSIFSEIIDPKAR